MANNRLIDNEESLDELILGGLKIFQAKKGYRFSLDAVLLAHFPELKGVQQVVDIGTGNGVIPLILSQRGSLFKIDGIEIQENMVIRATKSIILNKMQERIKILHADVRNIENYLPGGYADLVLSNPPFWKKGEGRISKNQEEAIARHELYLDMEELLDRAAYLLASSGILAIIQRADRLEEIITLFNKKGFLLKRLRMVHSFVDREAKLFLIEGQKKGRGTLRVLPPLIIYKEKGEYCEEIKQLYA